MAAELSTVDVHYWDVFVVLDAPRFVVRLIDIDHFYLEFYVAGNAFDDVASGMAELAIGAGEEGYGRQGGFRHMKMIAFRPVVPWLRAACAALRVRVGGRARG